jgi:hypothetical protein
MIDSSCLWQTIKVSDLRSADYRAEQSQAVGSFLLTLDVLMPALLAYLLAISVALGGGYAGLQWLAAPDSSTDQHSDTGAKLLNKRKKLPEKPDSSDAKKSEAESGPKDKDKAEITAISTPSVASSKAPETLRNETSVSEVTQRAPTQKNDDGPTGGCSPIGVTASGHLVFPMQCQAFVERNRPEDSQVPVSTNPPESAAPPKERQAVEPAPAADQVTGLNRERSVNQANAKVEDVSPSGEAKPRKEDSEPEVLKGKKVGKRNMQSSSSKPVMMILRTVEFPDGRREQRLLPMHRSRLRTEDQWFNPLSYR